VKRNETEDSVDLWRQVASAVEYIAAVDRPGFSTWDAVEEAVLAWLSTPDVLHSHTSRLLRDADGLRSALALLADSLPPLGVEGGCSVSASLAGALNEWLHDVMSNCNGGQRFGGG